MNRERIDRNGALVALCCRRRAVTRSAARRSAEPDPAVIAAAAVARLSLCPLPLCPLPALVLFVRYLNRGARNGCVDFVWCL